MWLEVTDCFSHPNNILNPKEYKKRMMNVLKDFYVDNCSVGWYFVTDCSPFASVEFLEAQIQLQKELDLENTARSIVLVLDTSKISKTDFSSAIKAYRVKAEIVKANDSKTEIGLGSTLFDEIDIKINHKGPSLIQKYLETLRNEENIDEYRLESLNLANRSILEDSLGRCIEEVERLENENSKWSYYERQVNRQVLQQQQWLIKRKQENKSRAEKGEPLLSEKDPLNPIFKTIPKPSRIEATLAKTQLEVYSKDLNKYIAKVLPRLYAAQNLS